MLRFYLCFVLTVFNSKYKLITIFIYKPRPFTNRIFKGLVALEIGPHSNITSIGTHSEEVGRGHNAGDFITQLTLEKKKKYIKKMKADEHKECKMWA